MIAVYNFTIIEDHSRLKAYQSTFSTCLSLRCLLSLLLCELGKQTKCVTIVKIEFPFITPV